MKLNTVEELIDDIRMGRMVILMDDEDRENEGDLVMSASHCRPEDINFMAKEGRGLICLTLTRERCEQLALPLMVGDNQSGHGTNFTLSIEAAEGVTTGISAADRARTVQAAVAPNAKPSDIVQPGHIFPLRAQDGGVLTRAGHTEAGCDLARLAGVAPASVIVEIMNEDGTMARRPDLEKFAEKHNLKIGTIADLIQYRVVNEQTVERVRDDTLETVFGTFRALTYRDRLQGATHLALVKGEPAPDEPTLTRVHVPDPIRDLLEAAPQTVNNWSLSAAMKAVQADPGPGVIVLLENWETQTLEERLATYFDTGSTPAIPARVVPYLGIGTGSQILRDVGVGKMRLLSTPMKFPGISGFDLEVTEYIKWQEQDPT